MSIAVKISGILEKTSWIRKMFEEGAQLKAEHGADKVFDFTLGNPDLEPPVRFKDVLADMAGVSGPYLHGYMANTGYPAVRQAVAEFVSDEQGVAVTSDDIIMTCGAAGALNVVFKAILDPGDEVITPAPYFVEYGFYVDNHGGVLKAVATNPDFTLDVENIKAAVTSKTKALLINSPNNPTGQVYSKETLGQLADLLKTEGHRLNRTIYLVSDEPYRKITFDGIKVPSIFSCYPDSVIATSYSKNLSIAGERIGFLAVNPQSTYRKDLLAATALANRILGYVNAPALMQRTIQTLQGLSVDVSIYQKRRDLLCHGLSECGYEFVRPKGAFYLFPESPLADDVAFVGALQEELILTVPGSGFGAPGHFRIAFCVDEDTIKRAFAGFERVRKRF